MKTARYTLCKSASKNNFGKMIRDDKGEWMNYNEIVGDLIELANTFTEYGKSLTDILNEEDKPKT